MTQQMTGPQLFSNIPDPIKPVVYDITRGMENAQPAYEIVATLISGNVEIKIPRIKGLVLEQLFEKRVADLIEMDIFLTMHDKQTVERLYKDLRCHVEIYTSDASSETTSKIKAYEFMWHAIIVNRSNISRLMLQKAQEGVSGEATAYESLQPMTLQLIHPATIKIRSRKTSGIYRDVTVSDMIYHLAYHFGIKTVDMDKPFNETQYENFVIEPMYYFNDVINYIQERYGIYRQGASIYYTGMNENDSRLRVYAPYFLDQPLQPYDTSVELLLVGPNNMKGPHTWKYYPMTGYDVSLNGRTETVSGFKILVSDINQMTNDADKGADYVGTMATIYCANMTIDLWRNISSDSQKRLIPTHKDNVFDGMKQGKDFNGFISTQYNPRYEVSRNNALPIATRLAQYNCDIISIRWDNARPFTFMPGKPVKFTYGDTRTTGGSNEIVSVPGLCMAAVYTFKSIQGLDPFKNKFVCECNYVLRLKREI